MLTEHIHYPVWMVVTAAEVINGTLPLQTLEYVHSHITTTGGAAT